MKTKVWLVVLLLLIIISQFAVLSSFFHTFNAGGIAQTESLVEIGKMSYVFGWASVEVQGPSPQYPVTLQFENGTQITLSSDYSFRMNLPRTGDCFCNGGGNLPETNFEVNQSLPIAALIISNATSIPGFGEGILPQSGTSFDQGLIDVYWFIVLGVAVVTITGYGVAY